MTDGTAPWHRAAISRVSVRGDDPALTIQRGKVVSIANRVTSATYSGKYTDHTTVNSVPEVWIADAKGQELRYSDMTLTHCRAGHEVVVVTDRSGVVGMGNFSTGQAWTSSRLNDEPVTGRFIFGVLLRTAMFLFIGLLIVAIGQNGGGMSRASGGLLDLIFLGGIAALVWLPIQSRLGSNRRNEVMRDSIHRAISAAKKAE
ncbi:MAG: hypothetical protein HC844_00925 [Tabrizicola sp.]|nr:hypothetical protein [Tabrizicola sp.]